MTAVSMRVFAAKREGRSHRLSGRPCQDAFASLDDVARGRAAAAVADGLRSQPHSEVGSQLACDAAIAALAGEDAWTEESLVRAFEAARGALVAESERRGIPLSRLATTLQLALRDGDRILAAMVGDGAIVVSGPQAIGTDVPEAIPGTTGNVIAQTVAETTGQTVTEAAGKTVAQASAPSDPSLSVQV